VKRAALIVIGLPVAAALLFVGYQYQRDMEAARARIAVGSRVVDTPCGPIEYADAGTGPPVLMIHGAGGGFDQSLAVGRPLIDSGFRVIAVSRFGYLRTPLPADASAAAQGDAHACLLDAIELDTVAVVGASLGAPSTLQLCVRHPERCAALVLVVPVAYSSAGPAAFLQQSIARVQSLPEALRRSDLSFWLATKVRGRMLIETLTGTPYAEFTQASARERGRIVGMLQLALPISARADGLRNDVAIDLPRPELSRINVPALVVSTETDMYGTFDIARYTAAQIPDARFLSYPTGGHLWVGHHAEMLAEIAAFLRSVVHNDSSMARLVIPLPSEVSDE
jgi:pimeloyl-ACP methyl ester carboxylesterase